jgi:hypothetical protein
MVKKDFINLIEIIKVWSGSGLRPELEFLNKMPNLGILESRDLG